MFCFIKKNYCNRPSIAKKKNSFVKRIFCFSKQWSHQSDAGLCLNTSIISVIRQRLVERHKQLLLMSFCVYALIFYKVKSFCQLIITSDQYSRNSWTILHTVSEFLSLSQVIAVIEPSGSQMCKTHNLFIDLASGYFLVFTGSSQFCSKKAFTVHLNLLHWMGRNQTLPICSTRSTL